MRLITRNVDTAFRDLVTLLRDRGSRRTSRNGPVIALDEPILITYERPLERVLVNRVRDANPFFHLYHALWLLAGRDDVKAPAYYVKKYLDYSDDGETANGSYGKRWRRARDGATPTIGGQGHYTPIDQFTELVDHLKNKPDSRRAVLQMWNVEDDLLKVDSSRDVCCNTAVYVVVRGGKLEITVTNRSNDLVWGCLGEDYVTFSVLQEYLAARVGVPVGRYHHLANDLHAYESNWEPSKWLADETSAFGFASIPLVQDQKQFDKELIDFVELNGDGTKTIVRPMDWKEPFLSSVAQPMLNAFHARKRRESPDRWLNAISADDWRVAATNWFTNREAKT